MLIRQISAPAGVFYFKKLNTVISFKNYSTITAFFFDRNFDFEIFRDSKNNLTLFQKIKLFFKRNPYQYDPFDEEMFPELSEKISVYRPEELMHIYYTAYWESWEQNLSHLDIMDEKTYFLNFAGTPILYTLEVASCLQCQYPFEMFAEEYPDYNSTAHFDSVMHDPYTNEELTLPLTTLRWNYYIENLIDETGASKNTFTLSGKLLNDLEENNDLISSVLEIFHEPEYRNTTQYAEYLNFAKIRLNLSFMMFVQNNGLRSISLMAIPWVFIFLIFDLLTNEFSTITVILCDLKTVFLYVFFGQELRWKFEETFKQYVSHFSGVIYSVHRSKYKKDSSTFKNDVLKVWRLINLETVDPKLYKKLKQYLLLSIKKKFYFSVAILRATAVRDKQYFRISLFNTISILRFFIWCYKRLLVVVPNSYNNFKNFLINLIPNTLKYLKGLYSRSLSFLNFIYKYIKSKI
jgi:hypothetical protein